MPVIRDIPLNLSMQEVLRRQGFGNRVGTRPEITSLIEELLIRVKTWHLLGPAVAYEHYQITRMDKDRIFLEGGGVIKGAVLPALFPGAKELGTVICTIGPWLETQVGNFNKSGQTMKGLLLDGIGSAAVDLLIPTALRYLATEMFPEGYEISSPVNPGMPGFPITEQRNVLELTHADRISVSPTLSGILIPRKSVSMVVGIGSRMPLWTQAKVCSRCSLSETCPYKVTS